MSIDPRLSDSDEDQYVSFVIRPHRTPTHYKFFSHSGKYSALLSAGAPFYLMWTVQRHLFHFRALALHSRSCGRGRPFQRQHPTTAPTVVNASSGVSLLLDASGSLL
ncbi:hypothetical protein Y032_0031g2375 [Ancylostoma ceylanicum]|uniref:Uncharacterized protein n=1 Tax=Ancylostoma ceylanicum TaxID=53326 RepID=A0A016UR18_9BILA|nr:hypothetical protein Y032_0031g2375 [Ancylostoma ceylanicum]